MGDTSGTSYADAGADGAVAATPGRRPPTAVRVAVLLMSVDIVFHVVSVFYLPTTKGRLRETLHISQPQLSPDAVVLQVDQFVRQAVIVSLVFAVLLVVLAMRVWRGRNWARVLTLIYAVIAVLSLLQSATHATSPVWLAIGLSALAVNVAVIALLLGRAGRAHFGSRRRRAPLARPSAASGSAARHGEPGGVPGEQDVADEGH
ncbi:MAG: hypothetical protein QOI42_264 [Frankiaceae bacterium]|nr:hypothetical protein [Frankiaceae bacterium]